jgi:hypothetical protein
MRSWTLSSKILLLVGAVAGTTLSAEPASCQDPSPTLVRPQFGIGFVANAPDAMTGAGGYVILPRLGGFGLYLDAKSDPTDPSSNVAFEKGLTGAQVRDQVPENEFIKDESRWQSVNVALVRPFNPYLILYAGVGLAKRTVFELYEEPSQTWGLGGVLWVEAPDREETRANFMVGTILRLGARISTQFGFETQPGGVTVGLSARLPRW